MPTEISRTITQDGFIRIAYDDGTWADIFISPKAPQNIEVDAEHDPAINAGHIIADPQ